MKCPELDGQQVCEITTKTFNF